MSDAPLPLFEIGDLVRWRRGGKVNPLSIIVGLATFDGKNPAPRYTIWTLAGGGRYEGILESDLLKQTRADLLTAFLGDQTEGHKIRNDFDPLGR